MLSIAIRSAQLPQTPRKSAVCCSVRYVWSVLRSRSAGAGASQGIGYDADKFPLEEHMPAFETIPLQEAILKTSTGKYLQYIQQLAEGQAGKLQASEGEKISTVRRRLGDAARLAGKNLVIKRTGEDLYFWVEPSEEQRPRQRGRRPRQVQEDR